MAGIGEASAILAVAQLGISLSNTLIAYIADVKDAPNRIQRISNEILTTSERLKEIGELIKKNEDTKIFSAGGINSAIRCSDECEKIIEEVKTIIQKNKWQPKSKESKKDEIDISLFSTLRWPFVKIKLEVPRAELQRIKIDLSLLFSSAMALGASTTAEKVKFQSDIPGLQRTREWAAQRSEQARQRAEGQYRRQPVRKRGEAYMRENEPELLQKFVEFEERRTREEEDRKAKDRAALIQIEEDRKKSAEKKAQEDIEKKAIENYKKEQTELERCNTKRKEDLRKELERLGFSPEQIQSIFESPNLSFDVANGSLNFPGIKMDLFTQVSSNGSPMIDAIGSKDSLVGHKPNRIFPWRRSKKFVREPDRKNYPLLSDSVSSGKVGISISNCPIEIWLIDMFSGQKMEVSPSQDWLLTKSKLLKKRQDVWLQFALLKPSWRNAITDLVNSRNQREDQSCPWVLFYLQTPRRQWRASLLGQMREDQLLQLILHKRDQTEEQKGDPNQKDGPRTSRTLAPQFSAYKTTKNRAPSDPILDVRNPSLRNSSRKGSLKGENSFRDRKYPQQIPTRVTFADTTSEPDSEDLGLNVHINSPHSTQPSPLNYISLTENIGRVVVGTEGSSSQPDRTVTYIPIDLVSLDTAVELEYPHYIRSGLLGKKDYEKFSVLVIEEPLKVAEVQTLIKHTREKMNRGELQWKPEKVLEFLELPPDKENENYDSRTPVSDRYYNTPPGRDYYRRENSGGRAQRGFLERADIPPPPPPNNNNWLHLPNRTGERYFSYDDRNWPRGRERGRYEAPFSPIIIRRRGISPYKENTVYEERASWPGFVAEPRDGDRPRRRQRENGGAVEVVKGYEGSRVARARERDRRYENQPIHYRDYDRDEPWESQEMKETQKNKYWSLECREATNRQDESMERRNEREHRRAKRHRKRSQEYETENFHQEIPLRGNTEREREIVERIDIYQSPLPLDDIGGTKQHKFWPEDRVHVTRRRSRYMTDIERSDETSEDDDNNFSSFTEKQKVEKQGQEIQSNDTELILETLKRFTTFTGDKPLETAVTAATTMATAGVEIPDPIAKQDSGANAEARKSSESFMLDDMVKGPVALVEDRRIMFAISSSNSQSGELSSRSVNAGPAVETLSEKGWESVSEHESIDAVTRKGTAEEIP